MNDNKLHEGNNEVKIIVNASEKAWIKKDSISYEEVVSLAFGSCSTDPNVVYTVTFAKGNSPRHEGTLVKGDVVAVKNRMVFNVTQTNRS